MTKRPLSGEDAVRDVLDAIPSMIFVMDDNLKVLDTNRAALRAIGDNPEMIIRHSYGEIFHCVHEEGSPDGCGSTEFCDDCVVRQVAVKARDGRSVLRERHRMKVQTGGATKDVFFLVTASPFTRGGNESILLILEDITELVELRHLIPICANCKKVRNDGAYWEDVESYLQRHAQIEFTHGLCPDCMKIFFPKDG